MRKRKKKQTEKTTEEIVRRKRLNVKTKKNAQKRHNAKHEDDFNMQGNESP